MSTSNTKYDWRKVKWTPKYGYAGFVPKWIRKLPYSLTLRLCKIFGHPIHSIEAITWQNNNDKKTVGFMCSQCYSPVDFNRILAHMHRLEEELK